MKMILSSVGFEPAMEKVFFGWSQIFVPIFKPLVILFQKNYSSTNLLFEILRSCADKILFIGTKFLYIFFSTSTYVIKGSYVQFHVFLYFVTLLLVKTVRILLKCTFLIFGLSLLSFAKLIMHTSLLKAKCSPQFEKFQFLKNSVILVHF